MGSVGNVPKISLDRTGTNARGKRTSGFLKEQNGRGAETHGQNVIPKFFAAKTAERAVYALHSDNTVADLHFRLSRKRDKLIKVRPGR